MRVHVVLVSFIISRISVVADNIQIIYCINSLPPDDGKLIVMDNNTNILKPLHDAFQAITWRCNDIMSSRIEELGDSRLTSNMEIVLEGYSRYLRGKYLLPGEITWRMTGGDPLLSIFSDTIEKESDFISSMSAEQIVDMFVSDESMDNLCKLHDRLYDEMIRVMKNGRCKPDRDMYNRLKRQICTEYDGVFETHKEEALEQKNECLMYIGVIYGKESR